jgi:hypothetical protein
MVLLGTTADFFAVDLVMSEHDPGGRNRTATARPEPRAKPREYMERPASSTAAPPKAGKKPRKTQGARLFSISL